jgi:hypothetical protein
MISVVPLTRAERVVSALNSPQVDTLVSGTPSSLKVVSRPASDLTRSILSSWVNAHSHPQTIQNTLGPFAAAPVLSMNHCPDKFKRADD